MAEYVYGQLDNVAVDIVDDSVTLNMKASKTEQQKQQSFNFETKPGHKEDIANLIASYSSAHQNWQRVGETKTNVVSNIYLSVIRSQCIISGQSQRRRSFQDLDRHCHIKEIPR